MENKKYIMIGSPIITKEIFRNILRPFDNYNLKPTGGFWASEYISSIGNISDWYNYLLDADGIASYKNINQSTIFTLKDNAKILQINSTGIVKELIKKYPSIHQNLSYYQDITSQNTIFDFEKISKEYDGVYVDFNAFQYQKETIIFDKWSVNTLLLFNLDCIKEYQTAPIIYDRQNIHSFPYIKQAEISAPQKIEEYSYEYLEITKLTEIVFQNIFSKYDTFEFYDYDEYLSTITKALSETILIIKREEKEKINKIVLALKNKGLITNTDTIPTNISLNYVRNYLMQDENRISSIPKSKVKKIKWYNY